VGLREKNHCIYDFDKTQHEGLRRKIWLFIGWIFWLDENTGTMR